jgi:serine/threonine-protein kinase
VESAAAAFAQVDGGFPLAGLAMVEHARGDAAASERALDRLKDEFGVGFAFQVASVYAFRGEKERAFEWLDIALDRRDAGMARLRVDVTLTALHDDPRFDALVKKVGYPE